MSDMVAIPAQCPACFARRMVSDGQTRVCTECGWASIEPTDTADIPYEVDGEYGVSYLTDAEELDTDEELPCVHADGCPGWDRCRTCYDREEGPL